MNKIKTTMPSGKRRKNKNSNAAGVTTTTPPPTSTYQQVRATSNTPNSDNPTPPRASHSRARRINNAFQPQYYPHWIFIGLVAVLTIAGLKHGDVQVFYDYVKMIHPLQFQHSWSSGWYFDDVIERRSNLSLEEFRQLYDGKRPVIIQDVLQHWGAMGWDKNFFATSYPNERVAMKAVEGRLDQAESYSIPLKTFIEHLKERNPRSWTYVEDELFIPQRPDLQNDIGSSIYLEEDFFKLFPKEIQPWNAMFLWGTRFSRSSLHIDPYNWTGTNAVFKGLKKWKLYPPGQDDFLYVLPNRLSGFPLKSFKYNSPIDAFDPDLQTYPMFAQARAITFTQHPGELLIIPTGWFHQAYNDMETIAVSSQVMNTANYRNVLEEILKAGSVTKEMLPKDFEILTPKEQVMAATSLIPQEVLDEGRQVTEDAIRQINSSPHEHT
ncbi:uncharacterized protein [Asterias amurensis]